MSVSIHASRVGCDHRLSSIIRHKRRFNSRTPCGVRPVDLFDDVFYVSVSIHAPRVGCDSLRALLRATQ